MTIPKVTRDLLMLAPSFNLSPTAPLALARSLRKKICVKEKANNKHSLYLSNPLGFPSSRSIQATRVATILNCKHYHPTLAQQRRGSHMTLYHQDLVATLSWSSEGPSHSSWGTISVSDEQYNTNYAELQYIAASSPPITTGTLKPLSIYQVCLLHKN